MDKRRYLAYAVVAAILTALIYVQFRTWKGFDWATFWDQSKQVSLLHILNAVGLIYLSYFLRALRWKIFLRPVRKETSAMGLIPPTMVGFTGLALLGRPGELIRPYLIARRTNLTFSSQMAVWAVERIFDIGAFTVLLVLAIFLPTELRFLPNPEIYPRLRVGGFLLVALVAGLALVAFVVAKSGDSGGRLGGNALLSPGSEPRTPHGPEGARIPRRPGHHSRSSFIPAIVRRVDSDVVVHRAGLSGGHSCLRRGARAHDRVQSFAADGLEHVGLVDSVARGGRRLAAGNHFRPAAYFQASHELAASCGILLWLATFVSVVPVGLLLAHRERLSLRKLSEETEQEEARAELSPSPPA